jgi:hypothetical protein
MRLEYTGPMPERLGFLLLPRFSMMAFFLCCRAIAYSQPDQRRIAV